MTEVLLGNNVLKYEPAPQGRTGKGNWPTQTWASVAQDSDSRRPAARVEVMRYAAQTEPTPSSALHHAFACCVSDWRGRNPVRSPTMRDPGFGEAEHGQDGFFPSARNREVMPGSIRAAGPWHPSRKIEVVAAFPTFGIQPAETLP
jgi:hypothetical protein